MPPSSLLPPSPEKTHYCPVESCIKLIGICFLSLEQPLWCTSSPPLPPSSFNISHRSLQVWFRWQEVECQSTGVDVCIGTRHCGLRPRSLIRYKPSSILKHHNISHRDGGNIYNLVYGQLQGKLGKRL